MRTIIKSALVVLCATLWLLFKEACALADSLPSELDIEFTWPELITASAFFLFSWLTFGLVMAVLQN